MKGIEYVKCSLVNIIWFSFNINFRFSIKWYSRAQNTWSTPAVWKQYNKMAVLHFFLVNSPLIYILFSLSAILQKLRKFCQLYQWCHSPPPPPPLTQIVIKLYAGLWRKTLKETPRCVCFKIYYLKHLNWIYRTKLRRNKKADCSCNF